MTTEPAKTFTAANGQVYELEDRAFTQQLLDEAARMTPGECIQAHRRCMGWSQAEAARKLGVSPAMLSQWEHGDRLPSLSKAAEIAEKLDMNARSFAWSVLQAMVEREGVMDLLGEWLHLSDKGELGTTRQGKHAGAKSSKVVPAKKKAKR